MRIALTGPRGQLGTELVRLLPGNVVPLARDRLDLTAAESVGVTLTATQPDLVINAAAYNLVDQSEDEPQVAFAANALGPRLLARWCAEASVPLVHVSSDYVFSGRLDDGQRRFLPYRETDRPEPLSAYAVSKLAGEHFVRALCPEHLIVRTCGLYGRPPERGKGNFVRTMLRLGGERRALRVVDDQECTPTSAADLAEMIVALLDAGARGTYHATNAGSTTWCELARTVFRLARMEVSVQPITTAEYGAKAARPGYSVLSTSRLTQTTGWAPRPWEAALEEFMLSIRME
ncbi:MAG TPA: dTDP-4-dehydrorhamnose reductase [Planctomycetaceae bacterium]|nr:dTDP-4-dehydrorhamnose reductase [Planctomycetaceae bacterium]